MKTIKKTTTYAVQMYESANRRANELGFTFHEYVKHLIANDTDDSHLPIAYLDEQTEKDVIESLEEYKRGEYTIIDPSDPKALNEFLGIE